jgi:CRISPR-associated protein Csx17
VTIHIHELRGCSPAPLACYLKALGLLRLIAEQGADPQARGWWQDEQFFLMTKLSRAELESFLLERYEPTPLLSPWNKGCGFFKANDPGLTPLESSTAPRFERFRRGVEASRLLVDAETEADAVIRAIKARTKTNKSFQSDEQRHLLANSATYKAVVDSLRQQAAKPEVSLDARRGLEGERTVVESIVIDATPPTRAEADRLKASPGYKRLLAAAERRFRALKEMMLIPNCRATWRGPHAEWLSAAVVLDENNRPEWPSLLGTGGNDGNLDFTNNFMQRLGELFDLRSADGRALSGSPALLANALWSIPVDRLSSTAIGQYQPGAAGGANSSTGTGGDSLINAWDFVLMMEGSLFFSARATRRLDPGAVSRASAPFAIRPHAAGFASPGAEKAQRGEQWMPLWSQPAKFAEVGALFGEARIQLKRETANRPIDAAAAIARLGVARGVKSFTRFGYLERNGQSTLAVPLGRIQVRRQPLAYLIDDLAPWMDRLQRRARDKHAPARLIQAERRLADAVLAALTHDESPARWQAILRAAVAVESLQAAGTAIEAGPIPALRPQWVSAVDDGTAELRLALALGSAAAAYSGRRVPIDPIRHHWLPLEAGSRRFKLSDKRLAQDSRVVMRGRDFLTDGAAIVERRLIEAGAKGQRLLPLVAADGCSALMGDLAQVLAGAVDLDRLSQLARALMAIEWRRWPRDARPAASSASTLPEEAWLALRLTLLPWPFDQANIIPAERGIVRRLLAGDSAGAVAIALARIRSAGIRPPLRAGATDRPAARLWAAALVFPIDHSSARRAIASLDPQKKGTLDA